MLNALSVFATVLLMGVKTFKLWFGGFWIFLKVILCAIFKKTKMLFLLYALIFGH